MTRTAKSKVLIIDDHPLLRQGIATLINAEKDFVVCGEISSPQEAVESVKNNEPDVVILDLSLSGYSGIEVLKNLKAYYPKLKVLILSMHDESIYAPRALRAGALGYVMKQEAPEKVVTALRQILRDEVYVSPQMSIKLLHNFTGKRDGLSSPVELLSDRELEVFTLLGQGMGTRDLAAKLNLSVKTIESHRAHIKEKLNLESGAQLVRHAIQWVGSEMAASGSSSATETLIK